ncbi:MAG: V0D/AC39 family V-type ATPase subunit, partial [Acutalibacteraceae bacterium]
MGYSANAIMAKSRALYGKRLTEANYNDLVNCKSIGELVSYLKAKTAYSAEFESANADITPFQVEELLKMHILSSFEKISRYEASAGVEFYKYFIMKNDIQQLLRYLNYLIIGKPGDYLSVLPPFFNKRSELDLYKLAAARTFDGMLDAIKGTPYYKALAPFKQIYSLPESYLKMECALDRELWETEKNIVSKFSGMSKEKIIEIISYKNDMENLVRIYR